MCVIDEDRLDPCYLCGEDDEDIIFSCDCCQRNTCFECKMATDDYEFCYVCFQTEG